jgi:hypothetical protein
MLELTLERVRRTMYILITDTVLPDESMDECNNSTSEHFRRHQMAQQVWDSINLTNLPAEIRAHLEKITVVLDGTHRPVIIRNDEECNQVRYVCCHLISAETNISTDRWGYADNRKNETTPCCLKIY